jgi:hypothetical protein
MGAISTVTYGGLTGQSDQEMSDNANEGARIVGGMRRRIIIRKMFIRISPSFLLKTLDLLRVKQKLLLMQIKEQMRIKKLNHTQVSWLEKITILPLPKEEMK